MQVPTGRLPFPLLRGWCEIGQSDADRRQCRHTWQVFAVCASFRSRSASSSMSSV